MSDLLTSTATVMELVSRLRSINKKIANAEFSNALADLSIELAEIKVKLAALIEENDQLKRELSERKEKTVRFKDFAYFSEDGDGPFCPGCYDNNRKLIRLSQETDEFQVFGSHSCPVCGQPYGLT